MPNGTGNIVVNGVNSSIVAGTAVASTSGTSIDFTSIPSWVKRVTVAFNRISGNGSSNFLVQLGTSGGIVSTGYVCACGYSNAGGAATANYTTGIAITNAVAAADTNSGLLVFTTIGGNIWCASGTVNLASNPNINYTAGNIALGGTLDRVRITTVNGTDTFDAGSINILYE
jgi:hypothetical protein